MEGYLRSHLRSKALWARYGHCVKQDRWICPTRVTWGLKPYERKSPELQARLAYTATVVGSYAEAEQMATTWGTPVSDGCIHRQVQELGQKVYNDDYYSQGEE